MLNAGPQRGFTLVESMVVVTIIGIFMLFAMPEMNAYLTSSRIRDTAQTFQAGLVKARAEAIRTNSTVEFVTTAGTPSLSSSLDASGKNWVVRTVPPPGFAASAAVIDGRQAGEGSTAQITQATTGLGTGPAATLVFNALGGTNQTGNVLFDFRHPSTSCTSGSAVRCMGVLVSPSGRIHLCVNDPSIPVADPRSCN